MSKTLVYCEECEYEDEYNNHGKAKNEAIRHWADTEHKARVKEVEE